MLTAFRVRNLRCIADSTFLDIRPIVVFVGRNSSGKSTLLRLFPLIKQSVLEDTREPILWFGRSVDFGSFDEAVSKFAKEREIVFEFRFTVSSVSSREVLFSEAGEPLFFSVGPGRIFLSQEPTLVEMALTVGRRSGIDGGTYTKSVEIRYGADRLCLSADENGLLKVPMLNGRPIENTPPVRFRYAKGRFFPNLVPAQPPEQSTEEITRERYVLASEGPYFETVLESLKPFVHGNTSRRTLMSLALRILLTPPEQFVEHLTSVLGRSKWKRSSNLADSSTVQELEQLRAAIMLWHAPRLLREASQQLAEVGQGVRYLEPIRARALRYYRFQELAIDEIDPQGENVPMFLSSLSYSDRRALEQWMSDAMGFQVHATREGGHAKLLIRESGSSHETNLADAGFGYSQVLPIILQLWKVEREYQQFGQRRRSRQRQQILAFEQPELHLHPHFQALLADIFALSVNAAKKSSSFLSLAVETHSEHLVNRLGELVERGVLSSEDIVVYLVERETNSEAATVHRTTFNERGSLNDPWPFGFFSPQLP